jgi:hypothetical protein
MFRKCDNMLESWNCLRRLEGYEHIVDNKK